MSKWVGEAEKMIQALFQMAKNGQPSIIFVGRNDRKNFYAIDSF
jgi:SpoVK/Ycf46/Vps4 family AAA+-type ATPase